MTSHSSETTWIPLFGTFEPRDAELIYVGKRIPVSPTPEVPNPEPPDQAAAGLALSNHTLGDGDVWAEVEFDKVTHDSMCQIAVAYDVNASQLAVAGIGGDTWALFSIREYGGPKNEKGWWAFRISGDRSILRDGSVHQLHVQFRGATVRLTLNGVQVATADVASPVGRARQVGILCRADSGGRITVRNFRVESAKPKAFMVMQFGAEYDPVYNDVVKEIGKDYKLETLRADEVSGPGIIISDIIREITESQLIIADISPANPNVYFEVGYGLALGKPTILLARKGTPLPFDVAAYRVLFYENSIGGKARLEEGLRRHLDAILRR